MVLIKMNQWGSAFGHVFMRSDMIDNETFRLRIGLFKPRINKRKLGFSSLSPSFNIPHADISSFLALLYSFFIVYFMSISLALTIRFKPSENLFSVITVSKSSLVSAAASSHIKIFSSVISYFFLKFSLASGFHTELRFSSRLTRFLSFILFWIFCMNFLMITIVNPSLLHPGPQNLSVVYQNVQGLVPFSNLKSTHPLLDVNKILDLQSYIVQSKPDIIALNETWLKKSIKDNEIFPDSQYEVFRNDRTRKTHPQDPNNPLKFRENGGGVLLAIRSDSMPQLRGFLFILVLRCLLLR